MSRSCVAVKSNQCWCWYNDEAKEEILNCGYFVLHRNGALVYAQNSEYLTVL